MSPINQLDSARVKSGTDDLEPATLGTPPLIYPYTTGWRIPTEIEAMVALSSHELFYSPSHWIVSTELSVPIGAFKECPEKWVTLPVFDGDCDVESHPVLDLKLTVRGGKIQQITSDHLWDILHTWGSESLIFDHGQWIHKGRVTRRIPIPVEYGLVDDSRFEEIVSDYIGRGHTILTGSPQSLL